MNEIAPLPEPHTIIPLLISLCVFFAIAGIIVPLLKRFRCSATLGYLLCGVIIGPYGLGELVGDHDWLKSIVFHEVGVIQELGELGVIALMFMIGLELSVRRLLELKHYVIGLGSLQIVLTGFLIFLVARQFDNNTQTSILIGASLALSSTAIVMQYLTDQHRLNRPVGQISFSILLMQDLAVVPVLVLLSAFSDSSPQSIPAALLSSLGMAVVSVTGIYIAGKILLRPLLRYLSLSQHPEWLTAIALFIVVATATLTQSVGLSAALGAFLAGLMISETEFRHEVEVIIEPVKGLLLGVFFLSIGMTIDIGAIMMEPYWLAGSVVGVLLLKVMVLLPLCLAFGIKRTKAIEISFILAQCGEFAFLILSMALHSGLIVSSDAQFFLLVTALSMFVSPLGMWVGKAISRLFYQVGQAQRETLTNHNDPDEPAGLHIIIAGFGRVGRVLGTILEKERIPYVAIDNNTQNVTPFRAKGYRVIYGDAKRIQLWRRLKPETAAAAVITIDDHEASVQILKAIRSEWPMLPIIIRAKDTSTMEKLYDMGASAVVPEAMESSLQLAKNLLGTLGLNQDELDELMERRRKQLVLEHADTGGIV